MSSSWLIVIASLLFAIMGVCVKLASAHYSSGEIVMWQIEHIQGDEVCKATIASTTSGRPEIRRAVSRILAAKPVT